jgi:hypothetical protein
MLTISRGGKVRNISGLKKYDPYIGHANHVRRAQFEEGICLERQMQFKTHTILMPF